MGEFEQHITLKKRKITTNNNAINKVKLPKILNFSYLSLCLYSQDFKISTKAY